MKALKLFFIFTTLFFISGLSPLLAKKPGMHVLTVGMYKEYYTLDKKKLINNIDSSLSQDFENSEFLAADKLLISYNLDLEFPVFELSVAIGDQTYNGDKIFNDSYQSLNIKSFQFTFSSFAVEQKIYTIYLKNGQIVEKKYIIYSIDAYIYRYMFSKFFLSNFDKNQSDSNVMKYMNGFSPYFSLRYSFSEHEGLMYQLGFKYVF